MSSPERIVRAQQARWSRPKSPRRSCGPPGARQPLASLSRCRVGPAAGAQGDFAAFEVAEELFPFLFCRQSLAVLPHDFRRILITDAIMHVSG
jgi:hypothetical protein